MKFFRCHDMKIVRFLRKKKCKIKAKHFTILIIVLLTFNWSYIYFPSIIQLRFFFIIYTEKENKQTNNTNTEK